MILCATWGVAETPVAKEENAKPSSHSCGVYFAPSTIPGAGFGMFAGTDYDPGDEVTPGDLVVPYVDMPWHNGVFEDDDLGFLWTEYVLRRQWFSLWSSGMVSFNHLPM